MSDCPTNELEPKTNTLPPWKVILHDDDLNTAEFVALKVQEITKLDRENAIGKVLEAHNKGVSLLVTTHREKAELYVEIFASHGITTTTEKA